MDIDAAYKPTDDSIVKDRKIKSDTHDVETNKVSYEIDSIEAKRITEYIVNEINKEYDEWLAGLSNEDSVKAFQAQTDFVREHAEYAPTANQEESEVAPVTEDTYNDEEEDWSAAAAELGLSLEDETTEEGDSITLF